MNKTIIKQIISIVITFIITFIAFTAIVNIHTGIFMGCFMSSLFQLSVTIKTPQNSKKSELNLIIFVLLFIGFLTFVPSSPKEVLMLDNKSMVYNKNLLELSPDIDTEYNTENTVKTTEVITAKTPIDENSSIVYIGKTGNKYHRANCSTLKGKGTPISLSDAIAKNKTPCKKCKP